ncbi:MAG: hypothetical protein A2W31_00550 [Planctomycetes bacterium RBG_16_64_10]|nr:MAG: hypothetical protein A2W31_00550 [Planctomycetes bacterium RBG_16_64_10]
MKGDSVRLARLTLPAKWLITLFLLLVGPGYLCGTANIYLQHQDADLEPGLTLDDLRRTFHGLEKRVTPAATSSVNSTMLTQVRPGGEMREHLERGGAAAIRALVTWLEQGAAEEHFAQDGLAQAGDPSAKDVIAAQCIECHNADGGEMEDIPYAATAQAEPEYKLVLVMAKPEIDRRAAQSELLVLAPTGVKELVHITHAHILTIPVFTLIVGTLFLGTGFGPGLKLILTPLPMLAVLLDISSWWLARFAEPFVYVIAASGAVFGVTYGLQILAILGSMWLGRTRDESSSDRN